MSTTISDPTVPVRTGSPGSIRDPGAPSLSLLDPAKRQRIHDAAVALLGDPGIEITTPAARSVLLDAGCRYTGGDVIAIPERLIDDALVAAPEKMTLFDRNGAERAYLGEGRAYFGIGVTSLSYEDPRTLEVRDFTLEDFADLARLCDALPSQDFMATPGVVRPSADHPLEIVNQEEFLAMVSNTVKPLMLLVADGPILEDIFQMAAVVAGGREALRARPFILPYLNTVSPLVINVETLDKLILSAEWGIPVSCQAAPNVGASSPATVAGTIAIGAAETLASLVIAQQVRPGTPFLAGAMAMVMDMSSGNVTNGGAPGALAWLGGQEMAHFWGLPQVSSGLSSDAKTVDEQAGLDAGSGALAAVLTGGDLILDCGAMEMGLMTSAIYAVMADENIVQSRGLLAGIEVSDETLALDTIREVGPGGHFLAAQHTLDHFRELWLPTMANWQSRQDWVAGGRSTLRTRLRDRTLEILDTYEPERLPPDVLEGMEAIIERARARVPEEE